jgi:hypothetical protein
VDFFDACRVVLRRWYVVVPLLLLTFVATFLAYSSSASNYSAKGSLVLFAPPGNTPERLPDNTPITYCDENQWCNTGGIASLGNITSKSMLDQTTSKKILDSHPGATYTVLLDEDQRSPIIDLGVTAPSAPDALATLRSVRRSVDTELAARQAATGVTDPKALITSSAVTMSTVANVQAGGKVRAAAAAFGLGLAMTLGGAFLAESIAKSSAGRTGSLLDRIALPDRNGAVVAPVGTTQEAAEEKDGTKDDSKDGGKEGKDGKEPTPTKVGRPRPAALGQRRSGRVGT